MLAGCCLRLLRRPAPAAGRQLSVLLGAAPVDCSGRLLAVTPPGAPPPRVPRRRPTSAAAAASPGGAARPGPAAATQGDTVSRSGRLPAAPSSALSRLTLSCLPLSGGPRSAVRSSPPPTCLPPGGVTLPCSSRWALSGLLPAAPLCSAVWPDPPRRFFSEQRQEQRRRGVPDMRRTSHQVRAAVGHMVSHENIYTVPNALCVTRIALTPVLGWLVTSQTYGPALACFVVAGVTDLLDGWIARRFPSQASLLGSFLDPLADKLLVATLFLSLTYTGLIPLGLTLLTVARDLGLIAAASWVRYKSVPPPVTLSRYFDPTFATAQLEPTLISKFNTFLQISLVASTLAAPVLGFVDHTALRVLWCVTAGTTVTSGMVYALLQSSTYKLMGRDDKRAQ